MRLSLKPMGSALTPRVSVRIDLNCQTPSWCERIGDFVWKTTHSTSQVVF